MSALQPLSDSQEPRECDALCRDVEEDRDRLAAEVVRLRARIHDAVDECQRRHAAFVSRCAQFDASSVWARRRFEEQGSDYWTLTSEANRLVILSIIAERDAALAEVARVRVAVAEEEVDLRTRASDAESALAELVRLKDGPRDEAYERGKPLAWGRARAVLAQMPAAPAEPSVGSPTPEVGTQASDVHLWDLLGGPRAGFCCQDAYASASRGEELHTGGCPRRCSKWVRTQRGPVEFYPCGLTKDHAGDCWLHPAYRADPSLPETSEGCTE